jgi:exodeoxyribonuclease V alpha subunit
MRLGTIEMDAQRGQYLEKLTGIVERVTFHNARSGWSVFKVAPFQEPQKLGNRCTSFAVPN